MICDEERRNSFLDKISRFYRYFIKRGKKRANNLTSEDIQSQFGREFSTKTANLKPATDHTVLSVQGSEPAQADHMQRLDLIKLRPPPALTDRRKNSLMRSSEYLKFMEQEYHSDHLPTFNSAKMRAN